LMDEGHFRPHSSHSAGAGACTLRTAAALHAQHASAQDYALDARGSAKWLDVATTDAYVALRRQRKKVEMLFAHLKRILKLDRLRLRGPHGAKDEFLLAATAQNLRKMAKIIPMTARTLPT